MAIKGVKLQKNGLVLLTVLLVANCCATPALIVGMPQGQASEFNLEGKITDLSAGKMTVSTQDNIIFHVAYGETTVIHRKDGSAGSPKDLKSGQTIKVKGDLSSSGVIQARQISIE